MSRFLLAFLVLAAIAAQGDESEQAVALRELAEGLLADAGGADVPAFLRDEAALRL